MNRSLRYVAALLASLAASCGDGGNNATTGDEQNLRECAAGYPEKGRCEGDLLYYCTDEGPTIWDCEAKGLACGADPSAPDEYICVAPPEDRCKEVSENADGICEGDHLVVCTDGEVIDVDCAAGGLECSVVGVRADCRVAMFTECGSVQKAECRGPLLVQCGPDGLEGTSCKGRGTSGCVVEGAGARCE